MQQALERAIYSYSLLQLLANLVPPAFPPSLRKGWRWALREKEGLGGKAGGEQKKAAEEGGDRKGGGRRRVAFPFWRRRHRRQQSSSLPFMPLCLSPLPPPLPLSLLCCDVPLPLPLSRRSLRERGDPPSLSFPGTSSEEAIGQGGRRRRRRRKPLFSKALSLLCLEKKREEEARFCRACKRES